MAFYGVPQTQVFYQQPQQFICQQPVAQPLVYQQPQQYVFAQPQQYVIAQQPQYFANTSQYTIDGAIDPDYGFGYQNGYVDGSINQNVLDNYGVVPYNPNPYAQTYPAYQPYQQVYPSFGGYGGHRGHDAIDYRVANDGFRIGKADGTVGDLRKAGMALNLLQRFLGFGRGY